MKKLTLKEWFEYQQIPGKFDIKKLQRWCREGLIKPAPIKEGRTYYVEPHAKKVKREKSKVNTDILLIAKSKAKKLMMFDKETALQIILKDLI